jgi:hypothetical protein
MTTMLLMTVKMYHGEEVSTSIIFATYFVKVCQATVSNTDWHVAESGQTHAA